MSVTVSSEVIGELREALPRLKASPFYREILESQGPVLARFRPVFSVEHLPQLTADEFQSFLLMDNNHHWTGLHRQGSRICSDMEKLRKALAILLDESHDVDKRLDEAVMMVSGMGKNIATAILLVSNPDRYGVWNNRSEAVMKRLNTWPDFDWGESFGSRYVKVNQILLQIRDVLESDLWTLDALWWFLDEEKNGQENGNGEPSSAKEGQSFGLERHLHEFMRDNWSRIELGKDWMIYQEPGDEEAGYEYPCDVGRIDLLAKHRKQPRWLVIELKRNQTSDQTAGQLLRYIGWVKRHLAGEGETVQGMIICRNADKALHYALSVVNDVELREYEVEFRLRTPKNSLTDK